MACVQNIVQEDSEREEGEIVDNDELDELSDISSEEEFLLRQRLHMLEKYNYVLERKNAKRTSVKAPGRKGKENDEFLCDLSEISASELEEPYVGPRDSREPKHLKSYHTPKRRKDPAPVNNLAKRVHRKKSNKTKKRTAVLPESSDESDDEYRNKRRKLAAAVNKGNVDKSTLKARLEKMLCGSQNPEPERFFQNSQIETQLVSINNEISLRKIISPENLNDDKTGPIRDQVYESVDLCSDIETETKDNENNDSTKSVPPGDENNGSVLSVASESCDTVDSPQAVANVENVIVQETQNIRDSDEDLELLREHALKTKTIKTNGKNVELEKHNTEQSDVVAEKDALLLSGEDSDTAELRLICLKSALLKKAFERKQKQKLRKRLSQSLNLNDELMRDQIEYMNQMLSDNNTDIESVDMDIGSDGDEKNKDSLIESLKPINTEFEEVNLTKHNKKDIMQIMTKEDEFEEDEDLLRAKLLTSLSKNLPNLVHPNVINDISENELQKKDNETEKQSKNVPEEKRFVISLGNSDSEGEHEATKSLTKMHMKLSEQADFQQKLDQFLKSTRMEVEKSVLPDVVQQPVVPPVPKTKDKFIPKTVNHLPKSEQIEYKILVKRMAELEKIKNARQSSINVNKETIKPKETLKPYNFGTREPPTNNDLEEQIALSRKNIAEESAKVLKLKDEATKLSHKYKIVSTELRNIATAITLNKKQQKVAQIKLSKIRTQHQLLINSSSTSKHSIPNGNLAPIASGPQKLPSTSKRPQKDNASAKEEVKTVQLYSPSTLSDLQSFKVSVVNDRMEEPNPRLSVQIDVTNNVKTVTLPSPVRNSYSENNIESRINDGKSIDVHEELVDRGKRDKEMVDSNWGSKSKLNDDYKSPLQSLGSANWDPNAVLCRFEVGGNCKDPDCKYLHPKIQEQ